MKKIILSVAVAAMALSTTASALEDIKVNGQAKVWYETSDTDVTASTDANGGDQDIFSKNSSMAEVVFKLGLTGKQGNVGFGAEVTQASTMGLEGNLVTAARSGSANGDMYVSKAYITIPAGADTTIKMGRQELNTPFAFTEKWNATQNNFDALVAINSSVDNLTLIGAYVGQTNTNHTATLAWQPATGAYTQLHGGAFAAGALFKNDAIALNGWIYSVRDIINATGVHGEAVWVDAALKAGPVNVKAYAAAITNSSDATTGPLTGETTSGFALCANTDLSGVKLSAAASMVGEGDLPLANVATNFKKTKLPTAGVYTDGLFVAQPETLAFKVKASGKIGSTGLALQAVMNDGTADNDANEALDTTEVDLIVTNKLGDVNLKGILMHRAFGLDARDDAQGGIHARVIASVNF